MSPFEDSVDTPRRVGVVTGTRAEFGLLAPLMRAVEAHPRLELCTIVTGTHLIGPSFTRDEVARDFRIDAEVAMQRGGETGRAADAGALGRGVEGIARAIVERRLDWMVVLGDRIEALAGASAACVAGVPVGHIHGGDRAEGIADEAIRHAITKLAHLHFPATEQSAHRIERMGEDPWRIHVVGSPALDDLDEIEPIADDAYVELGSPRAVLLMHPECGDPVEEGEAATIVLTELGERFAGRVLCLHPNFDAGREGILRAMEAMAPHYTFAVREHVDRRTFVGLLKRLARATDDDAGILVGNSSAALIEAAALRLPAVDVGQRQAGRERATNVVHIDRAADLGTGIALALAKNRASIVHPYGEGHAGEGIARVLAANDLRDPKLLRKRCTY